MGFEVCDKSEPLRDAQSTSVSLSCCTIQVSFHFKDVISNSPFFLSYNSYCASSKNSILDQLITPLIDIFLYSRHLSARYCINIVKIKSGRRIGRRSGSNK